MNVIKRNIIVMITNDFISTVGDSIFSILIMWYIFEQTNSAIYMSVVGSFIHITSFFAGPFAGVIVDRSRKPISILAISLVTNGFLLLLLAVGLWFFSGGIEIILIFIILFLRDAAYTLAHPSETKIIPNVVKQDQISTLFGYRSTSSRLGALTGNMLSGFIIVFVGIVGAIIINSVTFFISAFILGLIVPLKEFTGRDVKKEKLSNLNSGFFTEIKESLKVIKLHKKLRKILIFTILLNVASMIGPLYVVYVNEQLNGDARIFSLVQVASVIGGIVGGLSIGLIGKKISTGILIVYGFLFSGVVLSMASLTNNYLIALPIFFVIAFLLTVANISLSTVQIILIPDEYRGRISATLMSLNVMLIPIFNLIGGFIAEIFSVGSVFLFTGVWVLLVSLFMMKSINLFEIRKSNDLKNETN